MLTAQKGFLFFFLLFMSLFQKKVGADGTETAYRYSQPQILPDMDYICSQTEIFCLFSFSVLGAHNSATKGKKSITIQLMIEE